MRSFHIALLASCLGILLAVPVRASPLETGRAAYELGDYATAMAALVPLAEQGDAGAQHDLGLMYSLGRGVTKNQSEGIYWQRLSANQGNAEAQAWLGGAYFHGWGVPRDLNESAKWYRAAADQGLARAKDSLGALYGNGFGVPQDYVEALKWSLLALAGYKASEIEARRLVTVNRDRQAEKLTPAQIAVAERRARQWKPTLFRPLSVDLDKDATMALERRHYLMAARLLGPLAERGDANAQSMLGTMHLYGKGVPRNQAIGVKFLRSAAIRGEAGGQSTLGMAYERGSGISQDYVRAYMWYSLAAASGDPYADKFAKDRDKIASKMTATQIAQAQAMAKKCKTSKFKNCS